VCTEKSFIVICQFLWLKKLNNIRQACVSFQNLSGGFFIHGCTHYNSLVFPVRE
jgi:hypothetical protein